MTLGELGITVATGSLAIIALYGFCYLVSLLFQVTNPRTRVSLYYFVNNSHKLNKSDLDQYVRTNFTIRASDGVAVIGSNNCHTHLGGMLEVLDRTQIPNHAYIYDPPAYIAKKLTELYIA